MRSQSGGKERKEMLLGVKSCEAKINLTSLERLCREREERVKSYLTGYSCWEGEEIQLL